MSKKEIRQLTRDRLTMGFVVLLPLLQLVLFGYAINQDVRQVATAVVDLSNTTLSRRVVGQLQATQTFRVTSRPASEWKARQLLKAGDVQAVVVVPADFAIAYYRGRGAELSVLVDATDPLVAKAVRASADGLMEEHNDRVQPFVMEGLEGAWRAPRDRKSFFTEPELIHRQLLRLTVLNYYNPELRTAVFVVPALLGVILTTTMIMMTALAIVRERERGSFEFLIATPVSRIELMLGKIVPYIGIGFVQISIVLLAGLLLFRVPIEGSLFDLGVGSLLFIAANLTIGLVISSTTSTQLQATQLSFFVFLPSVLLSGFMFPFETMPKPAQWLAQLLPLTHFVRLARGILLRGATLTDRSGDLLALLLLCVVGLLASALLFRKRLG